MIARLLTAQSGGHTLHGWKFLVVRPWPTLPASGRQGNGRATLAGRRSVFGSLGTSRRGWHDRAGRNQAQAPTPGTDQSGHDDRYNKHSM